MKYEYTAMEEGFWRSNTELVEEIFHHHLQNYKYDVEYNPGFKDEKPATIRLKQSTALLCGQAE